MSVQFIFNTLGWLVSHLRWWDRGQEGRTTEATERLGTFLTSNEETKDVGYVSCVIALCLYILS